MEKVCVISEFISVFLCFVFALLLLSYMRLFSIVLFFSVLLV